MVPDVGIDDLPVTHGLRIGAATRLPLRLQERGLIVKGIAIAVVRSFALDASVVFHDAVGVTIDGHVQAGAEDVLMDMSSNAGRDLGCIFSRSALNTRGSVDDPGRLDLVLDCAIKVQIPVKGVFVVPDGQYGRNDQAACTADLDAPSAEIRMLPQEARVLLMDADGVFYRHH